MTTLNKITEQIRRQYSRIAGKREDVKPIMEDREIRLLVNQVAHELLAMEVKPTAKIGDINIPACMIATYKAQTVTDNELSLPAYPIYLPHNMGVWSISPEPTGRAYIPVLSMHNDIIGGLDEGLLEGQVGYVVEGNKVKFLSNPTATVTVKLLIIDPNEIGLNDPYPVPAEYESLIIQRTLDILTGKGVPQEKPKG